jgi:hypothetical protein
MKFWFNDLDVNIISNNKQGVKKLLRTKFVICPQGI